MRNKLPLCVRTGAASLSKSLFDKLSNANRGAGFAFEKAAPGCAHNLCAACAQIPHLPGVLCFVRGSRPRTKPIHILFRRARRNSTRFFDSLRLVYSGMSGTLEMPPGFVVESPAAVQAKDTISRSAASSSTSGALPVCSSFQTALPPKMSPAPVVSTT